MRRHPGRLDEIAAEGSDGGRDDGGCGDGLGGHACLTEEGDGTTAQEHHPARLQDVAFFASGGVAQAPNHHLACEGGRSEDTPRRAGETDRTVGIRVGVGVGAEGIAIEALPLEEGSEVIGVPTTDQHRLEAQLVERREVGDQHVELLRASRASEVTQEDEKRCDIPEHRFERLWPAVHVEHFHPEQLGRHARADFKRHEAILAGGISTWSDRCNETCDVLNLQAMTTRRRRASLGLAACLLASTPGLALAQVPAPNGEKAPEPPPEDSADLGEGREQPPPAAPDSQDGSAAPDQPAGREAAQVDAKDVGVAQSTVQPADPDPLSVAMPAVGGEILAPARLAPATPAPLLSEEEPKALPNAGYNRGFFIQSDDGDYKLVIGGRVTARLEMSGQELDGVTGVPRPQDRIAFSIPRAWIKLKGNLFTPDLTYRVYVDFGRGGVPELFDAFVNYRFIDDVLEVRVGQWRMPWTRQFINSIPWMSFQERSITMNPFDAGRDIGVVLHNDYDGAPPAFEYAVGLVNGNGITAIFNTSDQTLTNADATNVPRRFDPTFLARAAYNYNGGTQYEEIDLKADGFRFSVGAGSRLRFEARNDNAGYAAFGVDGALHAWGFSAVAELLVRLDQDGSSWNDMSYRRLGFTGQVGYTIVKMLQPSLRYSHLDEEAGGDRDEFIGGVTVLPFESPLFRVMVEGGAVLTELDPGTQTDWLVRQQAIIDF